MTTPSISVIVPAYKKADQIGVALAHIHSVLNSIDATHEIIVVVDGCPDGTAYAARNTSIAEVVVIEYSDNRGKGYALKMGIEASTGSVLIFADADSDLNPQSLIRLLEILETEELSGVVGSKVHPDSKVVYPTIRRIQSKAYRALNRLIFGLKISDTQTGLKVFRSENVRDVLILSTVDRFAFDLELLVLLHKSGFKLGEGPVELKFSFTSSVPFHAALNMLKDSITVAWRTRKMTPKTNSLGSRNLDQN